MDAKSSGNPPKFDRLLALRGNPATGLAMEDWADALGSVEPDVLLRAVIEVVRSLLLQEWADKRKADRRPQAALEAAEAWLADKSAEAVTQAKAAAKACTAAKQETFGTDHRVAEAARGAAWATTAKDLTPLYESLASAEAELLARIALTSEYEKGPAQRKAIVEVLRRVIAPPGAKAEAQAPLPVDSTPVPYSADGRFEVGQCVMHKKFGETRVVNAGETWVEIQLADGTTKRLAHRQ